jgi:broad specificity phosphatase PhoE
VFLRVRSFIDWLSFEHAGKRVLVVAHQVVVLGFRYVLERMTEGEILAVDREGDVANCAVTTFALGRASNGRSVLALRSYNTVAPVVEAGEAVTRRADVPSAPR